MKVPPRLAAKDTTTEGEELDRAANSFPKQPGIIPGWEKGPQAAVKLT